MNRGALIGGLAAVAVCGSAQADAPVPETSAKPAVQKRTADLVSQGRIVAARKYARARGRGVSFAVIDSPGGRPRGLHKYAEYPSASVSKAMMMVAVLRRAALA